MQIQSLYDVYQTLPDSRTATGKRFNQAGVLALITLALIAQQNSLRQISAWVAASDPALGARLGFRFNRMPSYGTIRRVLLHLDLAALRQALAQWAQTLTCSRSSVCVLSTFPGNSSAVVSRECSFRKRMSMQIEADQRRSRVCR
jgi:DDE_Tnp_1-associated